MNYEIIDNSFKKVTISFSSSEDILKDSYGEVLKPETINYRTHRPELDGLFCERIFGPTKDFECVCGKYKKKRYKGLICDRCGVEIIEKQVRRYRIGHINLIVPIVHIWGFRSLPNKIGYVLGLSSKKLDMIIYYERYVVIQPGIAQDYKNLYIKKFSLLTEEEYLFILNYLPKENQYLSNNDPNKFIAKMGAECLKELLKNVDLKLLSSSLKDQANKETSKQRRFESFKRLNIVESFKEGEKKGGQLTNLIFKVIPVIPPELRPLVPLDGGRFASSDLNDFYRRILIRNNRLKRLIEIKAPEIILRNEKRMLQESVDSLFDNSRKITAIKSESNRPLKSLSDSLKGKQGRFRQNLLGKRVDYSARSVIVVGPKLKLNECGLPKYIAAEIYKPFIIKILLERGIVKTVKSAKRLIDKKYPMIWDILENLVKGHPVLLNRAPTLHRLGIQSFQPKLIEGKAIELHPLVCSAFNADFDGDQMAVHLPLSTEAILEAKLLMLASQNILNPANGDPITVPSQDMVLGLYYMTKELKSTPEKKIKGEGMCFSSLEEVEIAYNNNIVDIHAIMKVKVKMLQNNELISKIIETTVGRALFNIVVPKQVGYINELLTKKSLRDIISKILNKTNIPTTAKFLDEIKELGFYHAFKGGLSFNINDIKIPKEKTKMIKKAIEKVDLVKSHYNMGLITNNERYNKIIDIWTNTNAKLTEKVINYMQYSKQGFNSIYMMLDSGARSSKEQIRQLSGMRGLMAKPQKTSLRGSEIIENPILSNFLEGLSILEYFISTHGARKGLADTALKTADAGYLTRRLVDSAQDIIIKENDCKSSLGIRISALKKNEEIIEPFSSRILGRIVLKNVYNPINNKLLIKSSEIINKKNLKLITEASIDSIEVRSPLTCKSKTGICIKCYGKNLANGFMVQKGEAIGVIAAQSIGEPGTQLTLRTFHVGGTAGNIYKSSKIKAKYDGIIKYKDIKVVKNNFEKIVVSRSSEIILLNKNGVVLMKKNIPYGSKLFVYNKQFLKKDEIICSWDPYNAVIIAELSGIIKYENLEKGLTFKVQIDEQTGFKEKIILEGKNIIPTLKIVNKKNKVLKTYNLPIGGHLIVNDGDYINEGTILIKTPRKYFQSGDITGGLPRLSELFEARNPSNSAIISEIDGIVSFGKLKRGNKEIILKSKRGKKKKYLIRRSKQIIVQENDFIKAGRPLSDGDISLYDILNIKGLKAAQKYLINEIQKVYRLQGVKINDKHFEIIVRQMMQKVKIIKSGDSKFLEGNIEFKKTFIEENKKILEMKVIEESGDSKKFVKGDLIYIKDLIKENNFLFFSNKKQLKFRNTNIAISKPIIQGITKAALQTKSFISAASFQETTKVLTEAAIKKKTDYLNGLKENVIVGNKIPAGTGFTKFKKIYMIDDLNY
ncbi:DNA-directed RNA polymerase subunit beta' [Candidatus Karelsulcia muelleri]|uniref:DNA-directed RNA polymerase subunit beta' n=1 Tax=Candidatus Karelsulcia muelleri TaxID=336810 RepID=UPI0035C90AEF